MAKKIAFTDDRVRRLKAPTTGRTYWYDSKQPGLAVCKTAAGSVSWYFYRWYEGKPVRAQLGGFPEYNTLQARQLAVAKIAEQDSGKDIMAERKGRRHGPTFGQLWQHWMAHAEQRKAASSLRNDRSNYSRFLERWAARRLDSFTKTEIAELHSKVGEENGRYQANRLLALVKAMFGKAEDIGFDGRNPAAKIPMFREEKRDRFLHGDELQRFFAALADEVPDFQDVLVLLLLTGARRSNLVSMRWEDIDLQHAIWRIPETKAGIPVVIALVPAAVQILQRRLQHRTESPYVFPGRGKTGHLDSPRAPWERVIARAKLQNVRLHDLRRSLGSWQAMGGSSLQIIGASLGHTQPSTTAIYSRLALSAVRQSVEHAADAMIAAGGDAARRLLGGPERG